MKRKNESATREKAHSQWTKFGEQVSDKYFHCKANCEAAQRGQTGEDTAEVLGDTREWLDANVKGDRPQQCQADQAANQAGRQAGAQSRNPSGTGPPSQSCSAACAQYRPNGLPPQF